MGLHSSLRRGKMQICNRVRILNIPSPVPQPCCGEPSGEGSTGTFISIHTKSPWCIFQAILMNTRVGFQVVSYAYLRSGGVPTRHTHRSDGLHTRHLLESTHTNTNKRTARPDKVRCGLTPWRRPPHQRRAPRPHPQRAATLSRSPTPKLCAPPPRGVREAL